MKVKVGGYVTFDTRKRDEWGYPIRNTREVYTEVDIGDNAVDDCGHGTNTAVKALEEVMSKRYKVDRHVECRECWQV